jgi:hypothetical protein
LLTALLFRSHLEVKFTTFQHGPQFGRSIPGDGKHGIHNPPATDQGLWRRGSVKPDNSQARIATSRKCLMGFLWEMFWNKPPTYEGRILHKERVPGRSGWPTRLRSCSMQPCGLPATWSWDYFRLISQCSGLCSARGVTN